MTQVNISYKRRGGFGSKIYQQFTEFFENHGEYLHKDDVVHSRFIIYGLDREIPMENVFGKEYQIKVLYNNLLEEIGPNSEFVLEVFENDILEYIISLNDAKKMVKQTSLLQDLGML